MGLWGHFHVLLTEKSSGEPCAPKDGSLVAFFIKRVLSQLCFKTILSGFFLLLRLVLKLPL